MVVIEVLDKNRLLNLPSLMIKHMAKAVNPYKGTHALPYGFLLSLVFAHYKFYLEEGKKRTRKDMFGRKILEECDCLPKNLGSKSNSLITQLINELEATNEEKEKLNEEIALVKEENKQLRKKIKREQVGAMINY